MKYVVSWLSRNREHRLEEGFEMEHSAKYKQRELTRWGFEGVTYREEPDDYKVVIGPMAVNAEDEALQRKHELNACKTLDEALAWFSKHNRPIEFGHHCFKLGQKARMI